MGGFAEKGERRRVVPHGDKTKDECAPSVDGIAGYDWCENCGQRAYGFRIACHEVGNVIENTSILHRRGQKERETQEHAQL